MSELRQNFATREWVVIATERARRPEEMAHHRERKPLASFVPSCPFCPGNEKLTLPEVLRVPASLDVPWHARVIPNKFGALSRDVQPTRSVHRSRRAVNGFGIHDVIVETPNHAQVLALMPDSYVAEILRIYKTHYDELSLDPRVALVTIFKNHGIDAGTSLEHPHSQMIATPVTSLHVRQRFQHALRHFDDYGECMFCQMIAEELDEQTRVVMVSEHFVALELYASPSPFCTNIYPRRHMASFGDISATETNDLARMLRSLLAKLYHGLADPDFNYTIRSAPAESVGVRYFHWYLSVIPRRTRVAGFELGSGMFINTVLPEAAAEFLRKVDVESVRNGTAAAATP
jgi:UDPglucose--hexose-1-phosphate uridylyltransferase